MDNSKLMQRLMGTFLEELEEHVRAFNRCLLELEKTPPPLERAELLKTLFRSAHSLKGAARSVNVDLIEAACHRLEAILAAARDNNAGFNPEVFELLFATADAIADMGARLRAGHAVADAPLVGLLPRLESAATIASASCAPPSDQSPDFSPSAGDVPAISEKTSDAAALTASLRVPAEKMDSFLARLGELLVVRRRMESRLVDFAALQTSMDSCVTSWQCLEKLIKPILSSDGKRRIGTRRIGEGNGRTSEVLRRAGDNLRRLSGALETLAKAMNADHRLLEQVTVPLDDEVRRVRMLPFSEACVGLERVVRDLAMAVGKEVDLKVTGGALELDRSILEALKDPLIHLVRNAIDHGLEDPGQRQKVGKPRRGVVEIGAAVRGTQVEISVQDDGRGLDLDRLREQARHRGMAIPDDERGLARLVFTPGLSTAPMITDVSGRGVGLDVVKNRAESLHGSVDLSFVPGAGTRFTLTVPLTLTTFRAALIMAAGRAYALMGTSVKRFVVAQAGDVHCIAGRQMLALDGKTLPFAYLADMLDGSAPPTTSGTGKLQVLILAVGDNPIALAVDEFVAEQEILIKSLPERLRRVPLVAAATLLSSGRVALVLNVAALARAVLRRGSSDRPLGANPERTAPVERKRLLVVEDSVTTRALEKSILEAAGYDVTTAVDGRAAWQFLQDHEADLIVSDVEMPHMDGFDLTEAVRASPKLNAVPVVLVTALGSDRDKARGLAVGADAYLVKSTFDQSNLLKTIGQLV